MKESLCGRSSCRRLRGLPCPDCDREQWYLCYAYCLRIARRNTQRRPPGRVLPATPVIFRLSPEEALPTRQAILKAGRINPICLLPYEAFTQAMETLELRSQFRAKYSTTRD